VGRLQIRQAKGRAGLKASAASGGVISVPTMWTIKFKKATVLGFCKESDMRVFYEHLIHKMLRGEIELRDDKDKALQVSWVTTK
jgi:hypothetical protein